MSFQSQGLGQNQRCDDGYTPGPSEVIVVQFLTPNARRSVQCVDVGVELAAKAKAANLGLSADIKAGRVFIYGMREDMEEHEELLEFATNGPGPASPDKVVAYMIHRLLEETQ